MNIEILREKLGGLPISGFRYFDSIDSTNNFALDWISSDAQDGSVVIADEQTAGRGRMDRKWVTRKGTSLAFTLIFRPKTDVNTALYAPLGALGVATAMEDLYAIHPQIKWPNDVLLNRKKVCGILTEASWHEARLDGIALGIGINIASSAIRADDYFIFPASTLQSNVKLPVDRIDLLVGVLRSVFHWRQYLGSIEFIDAWNKRLAFQNEEVQIKQPGKDVLTGTLLHISKDGLLWIRQKDGIEVSIFAGDVSLRIENQKPGE
jgi:BirA family biotin operon repressor/biotin-[acetyl-CoA-carboxylase] ligase